MELIRVTAFLVGVFYSSIGLAQQTTVQNDETDLFAIQTTKSGEFVLAGLPQCRERTVLDVTNSKDGVAHILVRSDSFINKLECYEAEQIAFFKAMELVPGLEKIIVYGLLGWDGKDLSFSEPAYLASVIVRTVERPTEEIDLETYLRLVDTNRLPSIGGRDETVRPLHINSTSLTETAKIYLDRDLSLPHDVPYLEFFRPSVDWALDNTATAIEQVSAARLAREEQARMLEAKRNSGDNGPNCRAANIRLAQCLNQLDNGGAYNVLCGGHLAGAFTSPASKCKPLDPLWCDLATGTMYNNRSEGAAAICPN